MNRAEPNAPVIVCVVIVAMAVIFAVVFALGRQWKAVLGAVIVGLAAYSFGHNELAEARRERERADPTPDFPPQPRRGIR